MHGPRLKMANNLHSFPPNEGYFKAIKTTANQLDEENSLNEVVKKNSEQQKLVEGGEGDKEDLWLYFDHPG